MNIENETILITGANCGIFNGLERDEDEIFPDPASLSIAEGRRTGAVKALERHFSTFVPPSPSTAA
jgi:hypothetical protein